MSHVATVWAYQQITGNPAAKAVLVALADKASDDGTCFPGQARLSRMTELSEKTVRRHIAALETAGLLSRTRRHLKNGRRTSDGYVLALGQAFIVSTDQEPAVTVTSGHTVRSERGPTVTETTGQTDQWSHSPTTTGHSVPPSTSFNRQVEPSDTSKRTVRRSSPRFEEFWKLYPKREGKAGTKKKWETVTRTVDAELILAGLRRYLTHIQRRGTDRQYVKNPETWLNKGCWDDEYDSAPTAADGSGWQLPDPPAGMEVGGAEWQAWRLEKLAARRSA